jgi:hypothetical protein
MIQPQRPQTRALKIDGAVALVLALSRIASQPDDGYLILPKSLTF